MRGKALTIAGLSIAALLMGSLAAQASGWSVSIGFGYPGYVYSPYWNPYAYPYAAPVYYPPYAYAAPPLPYLYYYNLNNYYGLGGITAHFRIDDSRSLSDSGGRHRSATMHRVDLAAGEQTLIVAFGFALQRRAASRFM